MIKQLFVFNVDTTALMFLFDCHLDKTLDHLLHAISRVKFIPLSELAKQQIKIVGCLMMTDISQFNFKYNSSLVQ